MGYKVVVGGMTIECETAYDVTELMRAGNGQGAPSGVFDLRGGKAPTAVQFSGSNGLQALRALRRCGPGATANKIWEMTGHRETGARGFGSVYKAIRRWLAEVKIPDKEVIRFETMPGGKRLWFPGPRIDDAIKALSAKFEVQAGEKLA